MTELLLKDDVYAVVGAAMEVYNVLGRGFLEAVYQEAMEIELADRHIPFAAQKRLSLMYKGRRLAKEYVPDLMCYGAALVELKAMDKLTTIEDALLANYLRCTGIRVGLLINFGHPGTLEWKRMIV